MKRKSFLALMGAVFVALGALVLFARNMPAIFSSLLAFPFEQLGAGLRILSLSGRMGNGLALALCVSVSLLPTVFAFCLKSEKAYRGEKIALCCLSAVLFIVLLGMANPSRLLSEFPFVTEEFLPVVKGVMGCTVWSFVVLWLMLRLVRLFRGGDMTKLFGYLRVVLYALCLIFVSAITLSCGSTLLSDLSAKQQSMDGMLAVFRFVASALPYVLDIGITLSLLTLLDAFIAKNGDDTARYAESLSRRCCLALGITAAATAALNVIQLLLSRSLSDISVNVNIPVVSLAFILLVLLLSRLITENRRLQRDNDLFI